MIEADGVSLIYIDRHLVHEVLRSEWFHTPLQTQTHTHTHTHTNAAFSCFQPAHEVTSPQAFEGLRMSSREAAWRALRTLIDPNAQ